MTAREFLDNKYDGKGYEAKVHDWKNDIHSNVNLPELLEEYHQAKLKLLGIADVVGALAEQLCPKCGSDNIEPSDKDNDNECNYCGFIWA
jgi:hypothetical protein